MGNYLDKIKQLRLEQRTESHREDAPSAAEPIVIEPAAENPKPVYWERTGLIVGPGTPEFLAKVGDGLTASYWILVQFDDRPIWINSIMLRSRRQFEQYVPLKPVADDPVETEGPLPPTGSCYVCRDSLWWVSIHGAVACGTCHPPASPSFVREWLSGIAKQEGARP